MLTLLGRGRRFCDGVSRRDFLKVGAFAGLSLADLLRARASQPTTARAKAAIMIFLPGGPSHLDMYDLKPDAPAEFRGEFRPIPTNVPGVDICEHFPRQAKLFDKLAVVRSVVSTEEHSDCLVMTGYPERENRLVGHPSFGAVVSKLRGEASGTLPPFVSLRGMTLGTEPGYLGVAHRPFTPSGPGLSDLKPLKGVDPGRLDDRKALLSSFDDLRRDLDASGTMAGLDAFAARAFDMVASGAVLKALDLSREDPRARERYKGVEQFLTARRLVEAGAGCVTLSIGGWDTHAGNFNTLRRQLPMVDRGVANLIEDLHARGMQDDVVTVMWGEFGRTPRINGNQGGRDHWAPVMSALVAGGGLKMGQAIGSSGARGERPKDRPVTAPQVLSTLYHALGIDPSITFPGHTGRPMYVLDDRQPIAELLA
ncbi:MAG TPA: DUF1501 domain-containing protein [Isosphaeraceae bacterium]|jgi:hypothetical protein|nr:DUF1501 domain-containing protein [Isosphaeraceae bacterium]